MLHNLDEAARRGLGFLKWRILSERLRYGKRMLDECIRLGAGGCQKRDLTTAARESGREGKGS